MSAPARLEGPRVVLRAGRADDVEALVAIRAEPSVERFWREADPDEVRGDVLGEDPDLIVHVIEVDGEVAGLIQHAEETDPDYRHASIDCFLASRFQGRGLGREAIGLLVRHLIRDRGHHRLTIDPSAANAAAIRCYAAVGFRPVGVLRQYERGADGAYHDGLLMDLVASDLDDPTA